MAADDSSVVRSMVLIDDDADFLHILKRRLQSQRSEFATAGPLEIQTFSDAVEAVVNLPVDPICVIIIDYSMPGCTGLDFIPKLVAAGVGPVLLLTNQNDANITAAAFRAGAANYMAKADAVAEGTQLGRAIREAVHRYRLETRNSTLTRQLKLANAELEAKNKRLHELTETAHQFVDDVAHDLRTPLTVIGQYASIVADEIDGPITERQRDHLSVVTTASHEMTEMIDDFLDSSKLRAKTLSVDREAHSARELFDSILPMLEVRAQPKSITIEHAVAEDTGFFFADLSKAGRVLTNLAVNAIKVTPEKGHLKLHAGPTDHGDVRISIIDQGPGLRPEDAKIIFERFRQLEGPQLSGTKGFGLGLSIVKQLAWLNLGSVEVQSELGKGSIFSFTLPANNLSRILECYLENIRVLDTPGDLRILHIHPRGELDHSMFRRLVSSCSRAMDLVVPDGQPDTVSLLGVCDNPEAWAARIREAIARFNRSVDQPPTELDVKSVGPWPRDGDKSELQAVLMKTLGEVCHV